MARSMFRIGGGAWGFAAVVGGLAYSLAAQPADPTAKKPDARPPSAPRTADGYRTIRISKPDGTILTLRVPPRRSGGPFERPPGRPQLAARASSDGPRTGDPERSQNQHAPRGVRVSRPTLGSVTIEPDAPVETIVPRRESGGRVGPGPVVAGDDPTEWRTGRGWAPDAEGADDGDYLAKEVFPVLEPGTGWDGETNEPDASGDETMNGFDAQAIARWNVVPYQEIAGEFRIGVVAFHREGIKQVSFSLEDGPWEVITEPALNPRTNTWEYGVTIDGSHPIADGPIEVRAVVVPKVGQPRVLAGPMDGSLKFQNGEHSMFLAWNGGGTLPKPVYYCAPEGDDTTGDGTQDNPFRSPVRALREATAVYGSADGATCYLAPGRYSWGPKPWPLITTQHRWPVLTAAPGVPRDQVVIDEGLSGGFSTALIAARGITLGGDYTIRGGGQFWLDACDLRGPGVTGPYNSQLFQPVSDWLAEYITGCDVTGYRNGVRDATLTRDTFVHDIWGVPFGQTGLLVNATADNIQAMGTGSHCDVLRWLLRSNELENYIAYGVFVTNADAQGIFAETQPGYDTLNDIAIVNVHISQDVDTANGSWWEPTTNHLLLWHVSMPDQPLRWAQESYDTSVRNVSIVGSVFGSFTYTPLRTEDPRLAFVNHIHYTEPSTYQCWFVGSDQSYGQCGYTDPEAGDYSLLPGSKLRSRVPFEEQVVRNDLTQALRLDDGSLGTIDDDTVR